MRNRLFLTFVLMAVARGSSFGYAPVIAYPMQESDSEFKIRIYNLKIMAEKGNAPSMYLLGCLSLPNDPGGKESKKWLDRATELNYGPAILKQANEDELQVGLAGKEIPSKVQTGRKYPDRIRFRKAYEGLLIWAKSGDLESMYQLGVYSRTFEKEGLATERECLSWLRRAANSGYEAAPFDLALALIESDEAPNKAEGYDWLKRVARKGRKADRIKSIIEIVRYNTYGFPEIGLKRNAKAAWMWAKKGAALEGTALLEFLEENGLENPDAVIRTL